VHCREDVGVIGTQTVLALVESTVERVLGSFAMTGVVIPGVYIEAGGEW